MTDDERYEVERSLAVIASSMRRLQERVAAVPETDVFIQGEVAGLTAALEEHEAALAPIKRGPP